MATDPSTTYPWWVYPSRVNDRRDVVALRGRDLRYAVLAVLDGAYADRSLTEIAGQLRDWGFAVHGSGSDTKIVADALRWEVRRGRAARTTRGRYAIGRLPVTTRRRLRSRLTQLRRATACE